MSRIDTHINQCNFQRCLRCRKASQIVAAKMWPSLGHNIFTRTEAHMHTTLRKSEYSCSKVKHWTYEGIEYNDRTFLFEPRVGTGVYGNGFTANPGRS